MGRFFPSGLGIVRGKVGNLIFQFRKGKGIVYMNPVKTKYTNTPKAKNSKYTFSLSSRLFFALRDEIYNYLNIKRRFSPEKYNLFIELNKPALRNSIPDKSKVCGPDNWVDISKIYLTFGGRLCEIPAQIKELKYDNDKLMVKWDTIAYNGVGKPDDVARIIILYCNPEKEQPPTGIWEHRIENYSYCKAEIKVFSGVSTRGQGETIIELEPGLDPKYLTAFLFFTNSLSHSDATSKNYSRLF